MEMYRIFDNPDVKRLAKKVSEISTNDPPPFFVALAKVVAGSFTPVKFFKLLDEEAKRKGNET